MARLVIVAVLVVLLVSFAAPALLGQVETLRDEVPEVFDRGAGSEGQGRSQISTAEFATVRPGITPRRLRELAGEPESRDATTVEGVEIECWYYGIVAGTGSYQFCFANGKLTSRFRYTPSSAVG